MPVHKFHTIAEASRPTRLEPETEEFSRVLHGVFRLAAILAPIQTFPPGVHKFRSLLESQARKMDWIRRSLKEMNPSSGKQSQ
jgi:hypothetical protein